MTAEETKIELSAEDKAYLEEKRIAKEENDLIEKGKKGELGIPGEGFADIVAHPEFNRLKKIAGGFNSKTAANIATEVFKVMKSEDEARKAANASKPPVDEPEKKTLGAGGNGAANDKDPLNRPVNYNNLDKEALTKLPPAARLTVEAISRR